MALQEEFNTAADNVKTLKATPADSDLLELYGLYKQATVGDCNTDKPGFLDFKGKSKWEAWNGRKGLSNNDAMQSYIDKAQSLIKTHGLL